MGYGGLAFKVWELVRSSIPVALNTLRNRLQKHAPRQGSGTRIENLAGALVQRMEATIDNIGTNNYGHLDQVPDRRVVGPTGRIFSTPILPPERDVLTDICVEFIYKRQAKWGKVTSRNQNRCSGLIAREALVQFRRWVQMAYYWTASGRAAFAKLAQ